MICIRVQLGRFREKQLRTFLSSSLERRTSESQIFCTELDEISRAFQKYEGFLWHSLPSTQYCINSAVISKIWEHSDDGENKVDYTTHHPNEINKRKGGGMRMRLCGNWFLCRYVKIVGTTHNKILPYRLDENATVSLPFIYFIFGNPVTSGLHSEHRK